MITNHEEWEEALKNNTVYLDVPAEVALRTIKKYGGTISANSGGVQYGPPAVFGMHDKVKPITGLPEGRARLRLRPGDFAEVAVKTPTGIRVFYLEDKGDRWHAFLEKGSNQTIQ